MSANRPAFLVTATDRSHVVIKQEVQVLQEYVDMNEYIANVTMKPLSADLTYLKQLLTANGMWYKMEKADGIMNILGRIIAADLWSGNNDRFTPGGTGGNGYQVCQNPGNVLLATQGSLKPIGLDAYEAMGVFRNYNATIAQLEGGDVWGGRLLADTPGARQQLKAFCELVIADLETLLGPRNQRGLGRLGRTSRLPSNAVTRLQHGVISGSLPIRAKMRQLAGRANPPVGLIDRLTIVGWWP